MVSQVAHAQVYLENLLGSLPATVARAFGGRLQRLTHARDSAVVIRSPRSWRAVAVELRCIQAVLPG